MPFPSLFLLSSLAWGQARSLPDFADLVEKQGPAVVNIGTTKVIRGNAFPHHFAGHGYHGWDLKGGCSKRKSVLLIPHATPFYH